ncbi:MAG: helix-turn-helix domain-containing protein [Brevundimonas sp.]|nr:MAG: helix-turn-helix domain-containing protein [Brevundimonas sp.]
MTTIDYRYEECGLDNVILVGLPCCEDDDGDLVIHVPNINVLHRSLAGAIAHKGTSINAQELRFLRTELGMSQAELAELVNRDGQTIGRWERGEKPIDRSAETLIRILVLQHVEKIVPRLEEMTQWTMESAAETPFRLDARDPKHYPVLEAA